uniref:FUZ/MON1/HPS1 first Longin domain-containing protein n=1 Tax=Glossina palpalis gambiensis TaxID=67801 RepID=A0A1B0BLQ3_9MUSC
MSIYLICLTNNGGLLLLTRKKGECNNVRSLQFALLLWIITHDHSFNYILQLAFSTLASLNGSHMFFKSLGVSLYTTYAESWTYLWKDFNGSITIIVCSSGVSENNIELLAELVFGAFSLFVSRDELSNSALLERLKKESKHYLPIIDAALEFCTNQLLNFSYCLLSNDNAQILQRLNEFSVRCGSLFCSLMVGQNIAVATEGWWDLHIVDRQLLQLLLYTSVNLQNDIAVYLPKKSPNIAFRFITIPVSHNSVLCIICGAEPKIRDLIDIAQNTFCNDVFVLQSIERCMPRCLPDQFDLDSNIEAIILANANTRKCVFSFNNTSNAHAKRFVGEGQPSDVLSKMFIQSLTNAFLAENQQLEHISLSDQYWYSDSHISYIKKDSNHNILCLLCMSSVPRHL